MLPSAQLSKTQVDRLGNRLRKGDISEADLPLLDGSGDEELVSVLAMMSDASIDVEIAIKTKDINRMIIEVQRCSDLFVRLRAVIRRLRGQEDDISN
jgi:hypothetical protein